MIRQKYQWKVQKTYIQMKNFNSDCQRDISWCWCPTCTEYRYTFFWHKKKYFFNIFTKNVKNHFSFFLSSSAPIRLSILQTLLGPWSDHIFRQRLSPNTQQKSSWRYYTRNNIISLACWYTYFMQFLIIFTLPAKHFLVFELSKSVFYTLTSDILYKQQMAVFNMRLASYNYKQWFLFFSWFS